MKFLVMSTVKDTFSMVPLAIKRQFMEAGVAWMDEQKKKGKLLEAYQTPDKSTVAICEVASIEDGIQMEATNPMSGFMDNKVYPLADFNKSMQAYIGACKQAEKLFPSASK